MQQNLLACLVKIIRDVVEPDRIILFGSRAREDFSENSDFDIMIVIDDNFNKREIFNKISLKLIGFGYPVDLVVVNKAIFETNKNNYSLVYYYANKEGVSIYEKVA